MVILWFLTVVSLLMQKKIVVKEKPFCKKSLDSSDVFILDLGLEIYQVLVCRVNCSFCLCGGCTSVRTLGVVNVGVVDITLATCSGMERHVTRTKSSKQCSIFRPSRYCCNLLIFDAMIMLMFAISV